MRLLVLVLTAASSLTTMGPPQRRSRRQRRSVQKATRVCQEVKTKPGGRGRASKRLRERESEQSYGRWLRGLLQKERFEEERQARDRIEHSTPAELEASGLALIGLSASKRRGHFYGRAILRLTKKKELMPFHRFAPGDLVVLSTTAKPATPSVDGVRVLGEGRKKASSLVEGAVLERSATYVDVAVVAAPAGGMTTTTGEWRLDKYYSTSSYERMEAAVDAMTCVSSGFLEDRKLSSDTVSTELRRVIVGSYCGNEFQKIAETPAAGLCNVAPSEARVRGAVDDASEIIPLDTAQRRAAVRALRRRLALIQGPPGTGKTRVAAALILAALRLRDADLRRGFQGKVPKLAAESSKRRVLACAGSHVAADNLLERLLNAGVDAVRIGQPAAVRPELRHATLDARVLESSLLEEKKMPKAEAAIRVLRRADVVVASCVGAGGDLLAPFLAHRSPTSSSSSSMTGGKPQHGGELIFADVEFFRQLRFGLVVVDEAAQATEPTSLVPIAASLGASQLVLVGDQMQLPPTVLSKEAKDGGLGRSLFERLVDAGVEPSLLTRQYRMHPSICAFPSSRFYKGRVQTCPLVAEARRRMKPPLGFQWGRHPVAFLHVDGRETSRDGSYVNDAEVLVVQHLVESFNHVDVAVVSPYRAQARAIANAVNSSLVEINTVDAFQGREMDIVIVSAVRANDDLRLGFLTDFRRLNVALTRAKHALLVVGHSYTLSQDPHWRAFIDYCIHLEKHPTTTLTEL